MTVCLTVRRDPISPVKFVDPHGVSWPICPKLPPHRACDSRLKSCCCLRRLASGQVVSVVPFIPLNPFTLSRKHRVYRRVLFAVMGPTPKALQPEAQTLDELPATKVFNRRDRLQSIYAQLLERILENLHARRAC